MFSCFKFSTWLEQGFNKHKAEVEYLTSTPLWATHPKLLFEVFLGGEKFSLAPLMAFAEDLCFNGVAAGAPHQ